jgi:hypothetical protein
VGRSKLRFEKLAKVDFAALAIAPRPQRRARRGGAKPESLRACAGLMLRSLRQINEGTSKFEAADWSEPC